MNGWALITGAAGGIGRALCAEFRRAGYRVLATDIRPARGPADAFLPADLSLVAGRPAYRARFLARVREALGGLPLKVVVNNAAVQALGRPEAIRQSDWDRTLAVNLLAPFWLTRGLLPELARARGSVVNVASVHARLTKPSFACYAASKAALLGLTRALALDLAPRVRVNAVCPAATDTPMLRAGFARRPLALKKLSAFHPAGRIARPEEVAAAAVYLASDGAAFTTGAELHVDGGIGARLHDPI